MDDAQKGAKALDNSDFAAAIKCYTKALTVNPHATDYYIKRSTAYSRVKPADGGPKLKEALHDADMAAEVTIKEVPDIKVPTQEELKAIYRAQLEGGSAASVPSLNGPPTTQEKKDTAPETNPTQSTANPPTPLPSNTPSRTRHEWYQSNDSVVITIYAKGVPKDKAAVDIQETSFSITFPLPSGSEFSFVLDPLFAPVDPSSSKFNIMSTKVEVTLRKQSAGRKWATLEGTGQQEEKISSIGAAILQDTSNQASQPIKTEKAPSYPTSSKSGPKDWDKVVSNIQKKEKKAKKTEKGGDSKEDGKEDDPDSDLSDYGSGDAVDSFFKKLYANSDPDTRRAMTKSFYESNGTALNTNWSEVGKGKVKEHPPSDD
ncbi:hypothetical protein MGYG_09045 [Nannizzia gypsea CBS 118893]|uniref:Uncharacterized protein n=1 Tax=Arthroderma gypseum (strain ATCC MYA-4604 / CBS 118893) TaxID=535722 RepID=E4USA1_ARTGP|nr:hypothetical protein MGYG_09045 [Nannizzia gypsea CBS 118893]EFR01305.1 hypothetical protein MGYG_09045 [Nannizzia gypsea CBS 118893]